jgi:hypothetical protein
MQSVDLLAWAPYIVGLVAILAATALVLKSKGTPTSPETAVDTIKAITMLAGQLVASAEQLTKIGDMDKNKRYDYAVAQLSIEHPELTRDQLEAYIEAAVYDLNQKQAATKALKEAIAIP